ncbi:fibronectin type-III domain-containing protein 3A-like [Acipenser ruthenus]|uniref:fibronectin type-III domain-containing protein 3A-like n=1 Tax=Acipenser ruthenus TaxID=7906 RepID=UPI0027415641|nr:fibronectin type-III domain-containing protein 3A-like [Acipenser ruthenus]
MNIPVMMAEQPPSLEATALLNEVSLLPHMLNGDSVQQVILVQVNPGETFTIRTEDGHIQCIQGPAHVPMMSPNGSMPPIFVPPGYMSQVVEENGVRKVVVLPHSAEFHPSMAPPPPHVPHYMHHHPAMLHHHHHHVYPPVQGSGELPPHFIHQHPPPHIYTEQEALAHGRNSLIHRDERTMKMQEHLRKRLKDRQLGGVPNNKLNSPPPSPHRSYSPGVQNGYGKGHLMSAMPTGPIKPKHAGRMRSTPPAEGQTADSETDMKRILELLSNVAKPTVSEIQARSAVLSWSLPLTLQNGEKNGDHTAPSLCYEIAVSNNGRNGVFKSVYLGEETTFTLPDLKPATDYHVRVSVTCSSVKGPVSEAASFTTECSEPDPPAPPRLLNRTKNSITLQWKAPNDNGSKIANFLLEYDEGKQSAFKECYYGHAKQYKVVRLSPSTKYAFRIAAENDIGMSAFSEAVIYHTAGSSPPAPAPPRLAGVGVTWLTLEWSSPNGASGEETLTYILEMEEESLGYGFKPKHNGEELSCTLKNLQRSTSYKFRVFACNTEGRSSPSEVVEYSTSPDKPGAPGKPSIKGRSHTRCMKIVWDPPKDNGGAEVTKYVLEMSESLKGSKWDMAYSGSAREHLCDNLSPGSWYRLRVYCISCGGQSQVSEVLSVRTAAVPPGPCQPPHLAGRAKPREIPLRWSAPAMDGGAPVTEYTVEMSEADQGSRRQLYQGPETDCTASNLLPGQTYCFWVKAANQAGYGPFSDTWEASTAPGSPEQCGAPQLSVRAATCVLVSWESPACNGAEVSEYRLEWGGTKGCMQLVYSGPAPSYEVKGLVPSTAYYCRVQALNIAGAGLFGEVAMVTTPAAFPAAVSVLEVLEEDSLPAPLPSLSTCLAVQWQEPCCHGADIIGYNIDFGERQPLSVGRSTSCVLENLQPDTTYRIRVQAVNGVGAGPFSHSLKTKTRPLPPEPPHLECAVFGHQSLKLKWGEGPSKHQLTSSTQYCLQIEDKNGRFVCIYSGPCHTYKVQRLSESTAFHFRIQAHNDAGEGPFSHVYTFTTTKSPPAQLKAPKVQQREDNLCEVSWEPLQPMRGDSVVYTLHLLSGRDIEQVYKGPETSFLFRNVQPSCEYRFRVCAGRQYQDSGVTQELWGPYSPSVAFAVQRQEQDPLGATGPAGGEQAVVRGSTMTDEQLTLLLLVGFAVVAILFAVVIQYFVIK